MLKEDLTAAAEGYSLAFVAADSFHTPGGFVLNPNDIVANARCLLLLFAPYTPANGSRSEAAVSEYYIASNAAYHAAKRLEAMLWDAGYAAQRTHHLPAREAALRSGGFIGDNGFYYHPTFGSTVHIQMIVTDAPLAQVYDETENLCTHCGRCMKACPLHAFESGFSREKCLRHHMNGEIPEHMRPYIYQLFGCERCQAACPLNKSKESTSVFELSELLNGKFFKELQGLVGVNVARSGNVASQSILLAAANGRKDFIEQIRSCKDDRCDFISKNAAYAEKILDGKE